ncbi:ATP-binding cassette domain-containing protein [Burkholderia anthina]|uniref:ATP-binding cassette domain-containing protein n=2 Tax=Burkholderia TaxID=32008 RepID=UPI00158A713D|nr:ATP-binding cassette domain-containing protein [Burkholderia anthina]
MAKVAHMPQAINNSPVLEARNLIKDYKTTNSDSGSKTFRAVDGISFNLARGRTLSIVGESGSGKSTVARMVMRLIEPTSGEVRIDGQDWLSLRGSELRKARRKLQLVFQDPYSSINPRMKVHQIISEPLRNFGLCPTSQLKDRAAELLEKVGLPLTALERYPHQFSGGQRQRIVIARALASEPEIIICDEAVSALDVSIQAQILNLLADIQEKTNVAFLFISHDLAVVQHISDEVLVMRKGQVVEQADAISLFSAPKHEYTIKLLDSVPGQRVFA